MERTTNRNNSNNTRMNGLYGNTRNDCCPICDNSNNAHNISSLMRKLQKIDFALYETVLYLDAYPYNTEALEYYHSLMHQRELIAAEYEKNEAPLSAFGNKSHSSWDWISSPWPWELSAN